jgi:hypothetical protein
MFRFIIPATLVSKLCNPQCYIHSVYTGISSSKGKVCTVVSRGKVCDYSAKRSLQEESTNDMLFEQGGTSSRFNHKVRGVLDLQF